MALNSASTMNNKRILGLMVAAGLLAMLVAGCASETTNEGPPDVQPKLIERVNPQYPLEMKQQGITGAVTVEYVIEKDGSVTDIKIVKSTDPRFSKEVVAAVSQWRFAPGMKKGRPMASRRQQTISFTLEPDQPAK